jgi:hypothetical protein
MGFPVHEIKTDQISEARLGSMIGESLNLGCAALAIALIFTVPGAPWLKVDPASSEIPEVHEVPEPGDAKRPRRWRTGLLRHPSIT